MPKNIVLCLDGTNNQLRARGNTNVVEIFGMLRKRNPEQQVVFYDAGVGTFSATGAWTPVAKWLSRTWGLIAGGGLKQNLTEAYEFVMHNYEPEDRIYIFGFSRGAYTARALAGLICCLGIFRPGAENVLPYAVAAFMKRGKVDWDQIDKFRNNFSRDVPKELLGTSKVIHGDPRFMVEYLGLFDTVNAVGLWRWRVHLPYTQSLDNVRHVQHAISIDERRRPYHEYLVDREDGLEEVWFSGVHSDVGGTFVKKDGKDARTGKDKWAPDADLSLITRKWMVEGAWEADVLFAKDSDYYQLCDEVTASDANGTIHHPSPIWRLLLERQRPLKREYRYHDSVRTRREQPKGMPPDPTFVDPTWTEPRPRRAKA